MKTIDRHSGFGSTNSSLSVGAQALNQPDLYLQRLCELAQRDQWPDQIMDWNKIDFKGAPSSLRQNVADLFGQLFFGEVAAFVGAAKFAEQSPLLSEQLFSQSHVADEARHVAWFANLMSKLDCDYSIEDSVMHLMQDILHTDQREAFVLGLHVFIEGMAHCFFLEGARAFAKSNRLLQCSRSYRSAKTVFGQWLPQYLGKDEGRHIAFGVYFLKNQLTEMTTQQRRVLDGKTEQWIDLFQKVLLDPKINVVKGLDGPAISRRCVLELNRLLDKVGMEHRIAINE